MENLKNFMQYYKMRKSEMDLFINFKSRIIDTFQTKFSIEKYKEAFKDLNDIEWMQPFQHRDCESCKIISASREGSDIHYILSMDCSYKIINNDRIRIKNFLFYSILTKNEQIMSDRRFSTKFTYSGFTDYHFFDRKFTK